VLDEMSRELQESGWDGTPILDDPIRHDWSPDRLCLDQISKVQP
jgi:hypothetical protein